MRLDDESLHEKTNKKNGPVHWEGVEPVPGANHFIFTSGNGHIPAHHV